jgi:radical SAM family uncharacterized protein/radical SAM-linked protein
MMNLEEILKQVEKPGRYLGGEWNEIKKDPQSVRAKIALVFPDLYEIGMSYLGQKILYDILNHHPSFLAERVFAPWVDLEKKLRLHKLPLFSLENKIPLYEFDAVGFSLLYELNYSNILTILELGSIPFLHQERNSEHPLILAGGPAAFNPEPLAEIFDLFLIGDGEEAFSQIIEVFTTLKAKGVDRGRIWRELAKIQGVYIPSLYTPYRPTRSSLLVVKPRPKLPEKIQKRIIFPFDEAPFPEKIIVPNVKVVFDRVAVEVERGCPQRCRFCQASSIYSPSRVKDPSFIIKNVLRSLCSTGYEEASLTSLSISDYPYLDEIVETLMNTLEEKNISLSLSSLRPGGLSEGVVRSIIKVKKTGFTIVPEAGTERLRRVINKRLDDEELRKAVENAFSQGWKLLKLYFMVGLPTEREEDLEGIVSLVEEIIRIGYKILKSAPKINLSISSFIPKPHTPFQWLGMESEDVLRDKHRFLKSRLKKYPFVRFKDQTLKNSLLEAIFSRGDRDLTKVLIEAWQRGARFDSWTDLFTFRIWEEAFRVHRIDHHRYLGPLDKDDVLPWDHIDTGLKKSHLWKELEKALREEWTDSCADTPCHTCQGCSFSSIVRETDGGPIRISRESFPSFGQKTDKVIRYRAFYAKNEKARYFSHLDVNNALQRSFRRAGIPVIYSEGFHPKMNLTFLPALPLGMTSKKELVEFKSCSVLPEKEFVSRVNAYLPSGLRFYCLDRLQNHEPSLHKSLKTLVYTIDLEAPSASDVLGEAESGGIDKAWDSIEKRAKALLKEADETLQKIFLDRNNKKITLSVRYSGGKKSIRPQELAERILGVENPVYFMSRENVLFETHD